METALHQHIIIYHIIYGNTFAGRRGETREARSRIIEAKG
jgi:hypothetical protein